MLRPTPEQIQEYQLSGGPPLLSEFRVPIERLRTVTPENSQASDQGSPLPTDVFGEIEEGKENRGRGLDTLKTTDNL